MRYIQHSEYRPTLRSPQYETSEVPCPSIGVLYRILVPLSFHKCEIYPDSPNSATVWSPNFPYLRLYRIKACNCSYFYWSRSPCRQIHRLTSHPRSFHLVAPTTSLAFRREVTPRIRLQQQQLSRWSHLSFRQWQWNNRNRRQRLQQRLLSMHQETVRNVL